MTILGKLIEPRHYKETDDVEEASSLKIPIETDAGSTARHWWMLFQIPKPDLGDKDWAKLDQEELAQLAERDEGLRDEELARRAPPLEPGKAVWMQVDVIEAPPGYRIFWKTAPTSSQESRADYAGSCKLTVGQVREQMGGLARDYTKYVNPVRKSGESPALDLYSCHTFVRMMNVRLDLGIRIPTIDKYD